MLLDNHPDLRHKLYVSLALLVLSNIIGWNIYVYNKVLSNEREMLNQKVWVSENYAKKSEIKSLDVKIDNKLDMITRRLDKIFNHFINKEKIKNE